MADSSSRIGQTISHYRRPEQHFYCVETDEIQHQTQRHSNRHHRIKLTQAGRLRVFVDLPLTAT